MRNNIVFFPHHKFAMYSVGTGLSHIPPYAIQKWTCSIFLSYTVAVACGVHNVHVHVKNKAGKMQVKGNIKNE